MRCWRWRSGARCIWCGQPWEDASGWLKKLGEDVGALPAPESFLVVAVGDQFRDRKQRALVGGFGKFGDETARFFRESLGAVADALYAVVAFEQCQDLLEWHGVVVAVAEDDLHQTPLGGRGAFHGVD